MKLKRTATGAVAMLGNLMEPLGRCLNKASARQILALRASPTANRRIARLARKCDEGQLTPDEHAEYQLYVEVGDFIAVFQAKARRLLASKAHA